MKATDFKLLAELLSLPTAPYREMHISDWVCALLSEHGVPFFTDPAGNLVIGCDSAKAYRQIIVKPGGEPVRLFIAHMDHPGFHGLRWRAGTRLAVQWHGGSPVRHLTGSRVWLATAAGLIGEGRLGAVRLRKDGHAMDRAEVMLHKPLTGKTAANEIFGGFQFRKPVWRNGKNIYTRAADDLVGVFAIVKTAIDLWCKQPRGAPPFLGLLTRAEEVGFVGAIAHLELGWLNAARRKVIAISLETSRTLPGAIVGKGPVVRLGDRRTVFDAGMLRILSDVAEKVLPKKHQRRIMDGGTCEATAATAYGLPAIGISVPLGNYHNEGFEGAPGMRAKRGPAPEFVHLDDIDGMVQLCHGLMQRGLPWNQPWEKQRTRLARHLRRHRRLLR